MQAPKTSLLRYGPHYRSINGLIILVLIMTCAIFCWHYHLTNTTLRYKHDIGTSLHINYSTNTANSTTKHPRIPFCLASNICLKFRDKRIYSYSRDDTFYTKLESPINYNASINHTEEIVPRIVHFIWFSKNKFRKFRFHEMLAMMAAARFVKPDKIILWHNLLPSGKYWDEAMRRHSNLYLVYRDAPTEIRGRSIAVPEHQADVARLEALLEFGGIYLDLDSFLLFPVHDLLTYDVTMGREVKSGLANGMLFSKPWCDFFKIWHHHYSTFDDSQWGSHSVLLPFQLYLKYPNLVHVEKNSLIRPNWQELPLLFGDGKLWNWRKKNCAIHFYIRLSTIPEPDPENIKKMNTTVGEVMRYIYYDDPKLWTSARGVGK